MKIQNLNLGKSLSRDEQKNVKGGAPMCVEFLCECKNSSGKVTDYYIPVPPHVVEPCTNACEPYCVNISQTYVGCECAEF